jgi:hypothetical protein
MRSWVAAFEVDSSVTPPLALDMAARRKTAIKARDIPAITKTLIKRIGKIFLIVIPPMKLPAAAYSAGVATSATKAGSCGVSCGIL